MVVCLGRDADCLHMVRPADANTISKPHHILPHLNLDWFLPFWYRLNQAVLEKRQLNGCSRLLVVANVSYSRQTNYFEIY